MSPYTMSHRLMASVDKEVTAMRLNVHDVRREIVDRRHRLAEHLGRRGIALLLIGTMWVFYGLRVALVTPLPIQAGHGPALYEFVPHGVRGGLWVLSGIVGAIFAFKRHPGEDAFGFAAVAAPPLIYMTSGVISTVIDMLGLAPGPVAPWGAAAVWLVFYGLIRLIAGWAEPQPLPIKHGG